MKSATRRRSPKTFVHPQALCEVEIGAGSRVWAFAHILPGAKVGEACNIGDHAFIEGGAIVGDRVTIKNGVMVWQGITIEDDAFIGPGAIFTNDRYPRSPRASSALKRYADLKWLEITRVERGASIGAGAVIGPGIVIGAHALVAAGAVVIRDVPPYRLVAGNPARAIGWVDETGRRVRTKPKGVRLSDRH